MHVDFWYETRGIPKQDRRRNVFLKTFFLKQIITTFRADERLMAEFEPFVEGWDFVETLGEGAYGE